MRKESTDLHQFDELAIVLGVSVEKLAPIYHQSTHLEKDDLFDFDEDSDNSGDEYTVLKE